jgi:hypothetical protein
MDAPPLNRRPEKQTFANLFGCDTPEKTRQRPTAPYLVWMHPKIKA